MWGVPYEADIRTMIPNRKHRSHGWLVRHAEPFSLREAGVWRVVGKNARSFELSGLEG